MNSCVCFELQINRLHIPTLPIGSSSMSMMRPVTPIQSPQRGGIFTSSRPPSAMEAGFDEEVGVKSLYSTARDIV